MGQLTILISDEAESEFRRLATKFGYRKGCLAKCFEEAIKVLKEKEVKENGKNW